MLQKSHSGGTPSSQQSALGLTRQDAANRDAAPPWGAPSAARGRPRSGRGVQVSSAAARRTTLVNYECPCMRPCASAGSCCPRGALCEGRDGAACMLYTDRHADDKTTALASGEERELSERSRSSAVLEPSAAGAAGGVVVGLVRARLPQPSPGTGSGPVASLRCTRSGEPPAAQAASAPAAEADR